MSWWKNFLKQRPTNTQLDSELRFHVDELTQEKITAGLKPEQARREAILEFG